MTFSRRTLPGMLAGGLVAVGLSVGCGKDSTRPDTGPDVLPDAAPTVVSVWPLDAAIGVDARTEISAKFSEPMDPVSIDAASFVVAGVSGSVSYDTGAALFIPSAPLQYETRYTATITGAARDAGGKPMGQSRTWSFTTGARPRPAVELPLQDGKRWRYAVADTSSVCAWSSGCSRSGFDGEYLVYADEATQWQGRDAWRLLVFEVARNGREFNAREEFLSQSVDALERWVNGGWRPILSHRSTAFGNGTFFLIGGPPHGRDMTLSTGAVAVPAGSFTTLKVTHRFTQTGQYAPEDIFDTRSEQYADGIGLVRGDWNYSFDDNDPQGADISQRGYIALTHVDQGPIPELALEREPNDARGEATGVAALAIAGGSTHITHAGVLLTDAEVGCAQVCIHPNAAGERRFQDWYQLTLSSTRTVALQMTYTWRDPAASRGNDLDLYLFQQTSSGLRYAGSSVEQAGTPERLSVQLAAGTYYVAVQAWDTPGAAPSYWLSVR